MSYTSGDVAAPFFNGTRMQSDPANLDQLAQQQNYPDFATMQREDPQGAQALMNSVGGGSGDNMQQAAPHDNLDALKMWGIIGGTVGAGALGDYFAGGSAAAGGAGGGGGAGAGAGGVSSGSIIGPGSSIAMNGGTGAAASGVGGVGGAAGLASKLGGYAGLINTGAGIAGGILNQHNQASQLEQQRQLEEERLQNQLELQRNNLAQQQKQFEAQQAQQMAQFGQTLGQQQGQVALNATQLDPFKQAKSREGQALLSNLTSTGYQPGQGFKQVLSPENLAPMAAFASPDAMQANEQQFSANAGAASGGKYVAPNMKGVGYLSSILGGR